MKILEVTNVDFSLQHFLLPLMCALRDAGHEVHGVCADGAGVQVVRREGFVVHTVPMPRSLSLKAQWCAVYALWRLFKREKPDIVHAHMPISGVLARVVAWLCGVRCIAYTGHGFLYRQPGPLWRVVLGVIVEWCAGRVTQRYMTVSRSDAETARRLRFHSAPLAIGNGRSPSLYCPDKESRKVIRCRLGVPEERPVVLMVARFVRHKGFPELLRAMEFVPEAELWIVGERLPSDHGEALEPYFARAHVTLGRRLRVFGARDDVHQFMQTADLLVLPSLFEGLPMVIIEAMLCGLPVVASDIPGPQEQVIDGETGFLVPPREHGVLAQAIAWLVRHPHEARQMGMAGRERAYALYNETAVLARTVRFLTAE